MAEKKAEKINELPPLIDLPVYQSIYCDQQTTDATLKRLWRGAPELVADLALQERTITPAGRDAVYGKASYAVEEYLRASETADIAGPQANFAIVDLLYETCRRIRAAQGQKDVPVFGEALATGPEGPFPELASEAVSDEDNWRSRGPMTQEMADKVCARVYETGAAILYAWCEQERRLVHSYQIENELAELVRHIKDEEGVTETYGFGANLKRRLRRMCGTPGYTELVELFGA